MTTQNLYVAHFTLVQEEQWHGIGPAQPERTELSYFISSQMFLASDNESAYDIAQSWVTGFEDANHDGPGDITRYYALGIHELELLPIRPENILEQANDLYGVDVGHFKWGVESPKGGPIVRAKLELDIFLSQHT